MSLVLWCDGAHAAGEQMRRDHALLAAAEAGARPVLRLFRFDPPAITLGYRQDPARELDLDRCRRDGIAWAVRPTGGRAILHAEEWTYAFAATLDDSEWGGGLRPAYERVAGLIVAALQALGVPARLSSGSPRGVAPSAGGMCFASTARHEVTIDGRKLAGSAQRRTARAFLQQGSILLGRGHLRLADYLAVPAAQRPTLAARLAGAAGDAGPWVAPGTPLERLAEAVGRAYAGELLTYAGAAGRFLLHPSTRRSILAVP